MGLQAGRERAVRVLLLGELRVEAAEGSATRFRMQKSAVLLAYLAYQLPQTVRREKLIEVLWPDEELTSGRGNLSTALWSLRQDLSTLPVPVDPLIRADRGTIGLNPELVTTDVVGFQQALQNAASSHHASERLSLLAQAAALYRGELLDGFYEDWIFPEQTRLEVQFQACLRTLLHAYEQAEQYSEAQELALRVVRTDPLCEEACLWLMRLYARAGQPQAALRQYRELERRLREELETVPSPALQSLARELAVRDKGVPPPAPVVSVRALPPPSPAAPPTNGPFPQESSGGAVSLDSPFYVCRSTDAELQTAVRRQESILLITGPRQAGKTSLLARGLAYARTEGSQVVRTDLQTLPDSAFAGTAAFLLALAEGLAEELDLSVDPHEAWVGKHTPSINFRRFLWREVFARVEVPLVWALDEVDRLFTCPFMPEVFGLFRSWHNERALDPAGPWSRFTLVMAYATEAHLFVSDLNQSPFNVGLRFDLEDFTPAQVADLDQRYGGPLGTAPQRERFTALVGGHPYLVRRSLQELARQQLPLTELEATLLRDGGVFKDHLRRLLYSLSQDSELVQAVQALLRGETCAEEPFFRLRSAGLVIGQLPEAATLRCELYRHYLERYLSPPSPGVVEE